LTDMKAIAIIPVHGRLPLLALTIDRLLHKNGFAEVICMGETDEEAKTCLDAGAVFSFYPNLPLGRKLNHGYMVAESLHADAVAYVSSSDWLSDNWLSMVAPYVERYDLIGKLGCTFAHVTDSSIKMVHWGGYTGRGMQGQPVGIGRMLTRGALERMRWRPFDDHLCRSLDYSMIFSLMDLSPVGRVLIYNSPQIQSLSISTHLWSNIHTLPADGVPRREPQWLHDNFPEIFTLQKQISL
jgi:hypothetical protein